MVSPHNVTDIYYHCAGLYAGAGLIYYIVFDLDSCNSEGRIRVLSDVTGSSDPPTVVNGEYDYATTFSLAGFDPTTANISGQLAADDTVSDILINGHSAHTTNNPAYGSASYKAFSIGSLYSAYFLPGINTIAFDVQNTGNGPSGLQVQMTGTATITPEPSAIVPFVIGAMGLLAIITYRRRLTN